MKVELFDGKNKIKTISILSLFRNNEKYLNYVIPRFKQLQVMYDVEFSFYFFENNSTDKSRELLNQFISTVNGKLFTDELPEYLNRSTNFERTDRLALLRNRLVDSVRPLTTDWTLLLDSDIYFGLDVLQKFFKYNLNKENIGMISGYATQAFLAKDVKTKNPGLVANLKDNDMVATNHYYDSFAFVDAQGHNFWPGCNFAKCSVCSGKRQDNVPKIPTDTELVDVSACFGGFALIQSGILNNTSIKWKTINLFGKYSLCEHVMFCEALRNVTNKRIVVAQNVTDLHWM